MPVGVNLKLSVEELRDQTGKFLDRGFKSLKLKIGRRSLLDDVARVSRRP
jgi:L-alanine-DL-glutamate epimerase-like enolase superfamily enzyme